MAGDLSVRARAAECQQMIVKFVDNFYRDDGVDDLRGTMFENESLITLLPFPLGRVVISVNLS